MEVLDFTRVIDNGMPVFPGDPVPSITCVSTVVDDGWRSSLIRLNSHTGTHIDAPAHMIEGGKFLNELPADTFFGTAAIADLSGTRGRTVVLSDISDVLALPVDFLLLRTGWYGKWGTKEYMSGFPTLSLEAAQAIAARRLKGIGSDTLSFDPADSEDSSIHKILLGAGVLLIENLDLRCTPAAHVFYLSAMPLLFANSDGAPARVIAHDDATS